MGAQLAPLVGATSPQVAQEGLRRVVEARKYGGQAGVAEMAGNGLAQYAPEVGCEGKVASFVELRWVEAGPASVNLATFD